MQQRDVFVDALFDFCTRWLKEQPDLRPLQVATIASQIAKHATLCIDAETHTED